MGKESYPTICWHGYQTSDVRVVYGIDHHCISLRLRRSFKSYKLSSLSAARLYTTLVWDHSNLQIKMEKIPHISSFNFLKAVARHSPPNEEVKRESRKILLSSQRENTEKHCFTKIFKNKSSDSIEGLQIWKYISSIHFMCCFCFCICWWLFLSYFPLSKGNNVFKLLTRNLSKLKLRFWHKE